ncbi:MAG: alpha/beta fold hydrolase [Solirubrobacteraceae bacterium]
MPVSLPDDPGEYGPGGRSEWLDVDWCGHQRWMRICDRWLNVIELGSGDPIVFVHGLSGTWQNWLENLPVLARSHRVIAFDLPGFGESEMPADDISISHYAECVAELLQELGVEKATVVGNSMGGFIGAELAIEYPERVERLVLVSSAGLATENAVRGSVIGALHAVDAMAQAYFGWFVSRSHALACRPRSRRLMLSIVTPHAHRLPAPLAIEQVKGSGKPGFVAALEALNHYPIRDRLPRIGCATLIVWGEKDRLITVRDADRFEELIPDAQKVVWPDTGHMAMMERPRAFNRLLQAFVRQGDAEPAPAA